MDVEEEEKEIPEKEGKIKKGKESLDKEERIDIKEKRGCRDGKI